MYGSVDAQIRANIWKNKYGLCNVIPRRYKHGGMLEPRPFYSKKWYRFFPDRIDNVVRHILKKYVLLTQGKTQWITDGKFLCSYEKLLRIFDDNNIDALLVSTVYLDDNYFLNSNIEYIKFNQIIFELSKKYGCPYIDVYSELKKKAEKEGWESCYCYDRFHPNLNGYKLIADKISIALREYASKR